MRDVQAEVERAFAAEGSMTLSSTAAEHLWAAVEQMDLLLETQHLDAGVECLISMLKHLRALKGNIA